MKLTAIALGVGLFACALGASADPADEGMDARGRATQGAVAERADSRGDRVEQRLDQRGDRIDRQLDRRGERADRTLDRRGRQIDRRMDHRGARRV